MTAALAAGSGDDRIVTGDIGWSDVVSRVRALLSLDESLDDHTLLASFAEIARFDDPFTRVQAAFDSTLGHWLALRGLDLEAALELVVAEIPKPRF